VLGYEACFLAGLSKLDIKHVPPVVGESPSFYTSGVLAPEGVGPHRPFKIIYASLYHDVRPTFVVDITDQFEGRLASLMAYKSQFSDQQAGSGIFPAQADIRARVESMARYYGMLGGVTYAEPFVQKEVGLVDDLLSVPVKSI
jgi:LmbE family N-acetylglucosaminyl deacetylase